MQNRQDGQNSLLGFLFGKSNAPTHKNKQRNRSLRIEELESREMLDAGLMSALNDAFYTSPPYESDTIIVETAGNAVAGNTVSRSSDVEDIVAPAAAPTPDGYSDYDWAQIERFKRDHGISDSNVTPDWGADKIDGYYRLRRLTISGGTGTLDFTVFSECTYLTEINVQSQSVTTLIVSDLETLAKLNCAGCGLTALDVSNNTNLRNLYCGSNQLTALDVSSCTMLQSLECWENQLTELDVSGCTALTTLHCRDNQLTELDVSGCTALTELNCQNNQLTELNVSGCTALEKLNCSDTSDTGTGTGNQLTVLDVSGCTALTQLQCQNNQLKALDVFGCTALTELQCQNNQLTKLYVSGMALTFLNCLENPLTELYVSNCIWLTQLSCNNLQLTKLDLSGCIALTQLWCNNNKLTALDVSDCTALTHLVCSGNQLTALDVSHCTALTQLECADNQLTFSTLRLPSHSLNPNTSDLSPQDEMPITLGSDNTVDISSEYLDGTTEYTWSSTSIGLLAKYVHYTAANGVFTFTGLQNGDVIYCEMTNPGYHDLTLRTTNVIIGGVAVTQTDTPVNSVTLTWQPKTDAASYEIEYWKTGDTIRTVVSNITGTSWTGSPLDSRTRYVFNIWAVYAEDESSRIHSIVVTTKGNVPDVPAVTVAETTKNSVRLNWHSVNGAASYEIQYWRQSDPTIQTVVVSGITKTSWTASLLDPNTTYVFQVRAVYADGKSDWSTTVLRTTDGTDLNPDHDDPPSIPDNLHPIAKTSSSITMAWHDVTNAMGYEIQWRKAGGNETWTNVKVLGTWTTVSGLMTGTTYEFQVRSVSDNGESGWSDIVFVTTPIPIPPDTPTGLHAIDKTSSSITMAWHGVANAVSYKVQWRKAGDGDEGWTLIPGILATWETVSGLAAGTGYEFQVRAVNDDGESGWSESVLVETHVFMESPAHLQVSFPPTRHTITLDWHGVANAMGYEIQWRKAGEGEESWTNVQVSVGTSTTVSGLDAETKYEFQVRAVSDNGESDWSDSVFGTTGLDIILPEPPAGLKDIDTTTSSITMAWHGVANAAGYEIRWRNKPGDENWELPITGMLATWETVSGLTAGTEYEFQVRAVNDDGESAWASSVFVRTLDHPDPPVINPDFHETTKTTSSITMAWHGVANATGYEIQWRKTGGDETWTSVRVLETWTTVSGLTAGTEYEFQVKAVNDDGESAWSNSVFVQTLDHPDPPVINPDFHETTKTTSSITMAWHAVTNATGYEIQWRKTGDAGWTNVPVLLRTWATVTGLAAETEYEFQVRAVYDESVTGWSLSVFVTTLPIPIPPDKPTELHPIDITTSSITMAWHGVDNASSYEIQWRKAGDGDAGWTLISGMLATWETVSGLSAGTTYEFQVRAVNIDGKSDWSESVFETIPVPPATPDNLHNTGKTTSSITMAWHGITNVKGYDIQWRKSGGDETWTSVHVLETWTTVSGLAAGTTYEFQVRAVSDNGESDWSDSGFADTLPIPIPPNTPIGLHAIDKTSSSITMAWHGVANASSYEIQWRKAGDGDAGWTLIPGMLATWETVSGLSAGTTYEFQVRAVNIDGKSDWSESVSGTIPVPPATPGTLDDIAKTKSSITMAWDGVPNAASYEIKWRKAGEGDEGWTLIPGILATWTTVSDLSAGPTYEFQVRAVNADGVSGWSESVFAEIPVPPPVPNKILKGIAQTTSSITLVWHGVDNASSYEIQWRKAGDGDAGWTLIPGILETWTTVSGLAAGTTYEFQVRAVSDNGESDWSDSVSIRTENIYHNKVKDRLPTADQKQDTLAAVKVATGKDAPAYTTATLLLPSNMIKKNSSGAEYTHIQIDIWGVKDKVKGVPLWETLTLEMDTATGALKAQTDGSVIRAAVAGNKLVLSGLDAGTKYTLQMQAVTLDGADNAHLKSKVLKVSVTTKKYTAVQKLAAPKTGITSSSVTLAWQAPKAPPEGASTRYEIVCMEGVRERSMFITTGTTFEMGNLVANTKYTFVVRAISTVEGVDIESLTAKVSAKTLLA